MLNINYIIFGNLYDYCEQMCADIIDNDNVSLLNKPHYFSNRLAYLSYKIHSSGKINHFLKLPFKEIWFKYFFQNKNCFKQKANSVFIFFDSNPHLYNENFLCYIKKKTNNARIVVLFVNSMCNRNMRDIGYFKKYADLLLTTDTKDALEYGMEYIPHVYSTFKFRGIRENTENDVLFVGSDKGRADIIYEIYDRLSSEGLKCDFTLIKNKLDARYNGKILNKVIPYKEVLAKVNNSRCILEVFAGEQNGYSLRTMEALMNNKKLITSNQKIIDENFYDPRYISIFSDAKDIDIDFIKKQDPINYEFTDIFSPVHMLEIVTQRLSVMP